MHKKIGISMEPEFYKKAKEMAERTGRTLSGLIRISIESKLNEEGKDYESDE